MSEKDPQAFLDGFLWALTIWREARGESLDGKIAVAAVIYNRCKDPRWPDTIRGVVLQPKQFSCFNLGDPNSVLFPESDETFQDCLKAAVVAALTDPTNGANHYHTPAVSPKWADPAKITAKIGNHIFYKL